MIPAITLADVEAAILRKKQRRIALMFPDEGPLRRDLYAKHMEFFAGGADYRERLFRAANRCISPWTYIGTRSQPCLSTLREGCFDVESWGDGKQCIGRGEGGFLKGIMPAFRLVMDSGQFLDCTGEHRLLTSEGYLELRQLVSRANGLRLRRRREDYEANCVADGYLSGLRLRLEEGSDGVLIQEPCDAQKRDHSIYWHWDEVVRIPERIPLSQEFDHLSNPDDYVLHAGLFSQFSHGFYDTPVLRLSGYILKFQQSVLELGRQESFSQFVCNQDGEVRPSQIYSHDVSDKIERLCSEYSIDRKLLLVADRGLRVEELYRDERHKEIFYPFSHVPLIGGRTIVAIVPLGYQPIVDFTVPEHKNYFAAGVYSHNSGKSEAGAYEVTLHLTGQYPAWWKGKRFKKPVNVLVAGESGRLVRDSIQEKLIGPPGSPGTGMIPYDCVIERRSKAGIPDAIDTVRVKHLNGESLLQFQAFDQGREAFQATSRDVVWLDEEPPLSVYSEALTRTMTTQGIMMTTFTPLKGMSDTIIFLEKKADEGKILRVTATWNDAPHLTQSDKEELLSAFPPHQRDARSKGIPALGSGAIYPVPETDIIVQPFALPVHWTRAYSMDVGWNRTAALFGAYDSDNDTVYLYAEHYRGQAEPSVHADAIKGHGNWIPGVIDPASRGRAQADGKQLLQMYQELGLQLILADNGVESGIYEVYQRLSSGRLKVFSTLQNWINEYRIYRRDENGRVVKSDDHLMDCTRYFIASAIPIGVFPPEYKHSIGGEEKSRSPMHQYDYNPLSRDILRKIKR